MRRFILTALASVVAGCTGDSADSRPAPPSTPGDGAPSSASVWRVSETGIGPLRAGMSAAEAARATGGALGAPSGTDCQYLPWRGGPPGVRVMAEGGRVVRVDVDSGDVATVAGARIGDTAARVRELYAPRVTVTPHKYVAGASYLTVAPAAPSDSAYRVVFETDDSGRVVRYRAGLRPQVEYVERCG